MKFVGTQYLRPPNPLQEHWSSDLDRIAAAGLTVVRAWVYWRTVEPRPGSWHWKEYDRFLDLAAERDLKVVLQLIPEAPPEWFIAEHTNLRPLGPDGSALPLLGTGMVPIGGYPGLFPDHPVVAEAMARFIREAATHFASHPALFAWDIWNEIVPHGGRISYDDVTTTAFQTWLLNRYGSIESLNDRLALQFAAFDEIPLIPPGEDGCGSAMLRTVFEEWRMDRLVVEMRRRAAVLREVDPIHPIASHVAASTFHVFVEDDWRLADTVDVWGTSHYRIEYSEGAAADYREIALEMSFTRSAANGRPWWLAEHAGGQVYYLYGHHLNSAAETRSSMLLAFGNGAEAAMFWQFRPERFGQEAPSWGLVNLDGSTSPRFEAAGQVASVLTREGPWLASLERGASPLGIVYDPRTLLYEQSIHTWFPHGLSLREEVKGWFGAGVEAGWAPDIVHPDQVRRGQVTSSMLYLPMHALGDADLYGSLIDWVNQGGILVIGAYAGTFDADGYLAEPIPLEPLATAIGGHVVHREYPRDNPFAIEVDGHQVEGFWVREHSTQNESDTGHESGPAWRSIGAGRILYVGTCPGIGHARRGGGLPAWMRSICASIGHRPWYESNRVIHGEIARSESAAALYLTNPYHEAVEVWLESKMLPSGTLVDLLTGASIDSVGSDGRPIVTIAPRDTLWLAIR